MNIPQTNLLNMLSSISSLNHVLNETLTLYQLVESNCPDCTYDPIRGESTDPYCGTCDGAGKIINDIAIDVPSSIETQEDLTFEYREAGRLSQGEILATIDKADIDSLLNTKGAFNMDDQNDIKRFLDQYDYFQWKGSKYALKSFQAGYLQGNFYEISMTLKMRT